MLPLTLVPVCHLAYAHYLQMSAVKPSVCADGGDNGNYSNSGQIIYYIVKWLLAQVYQTTTIFMQLSFSHLMT